MRWQGWVATLVFVLLLGLDLRMLADPTRWIGAALLSVGFALVARTRTRGGWRWRPGRS